MVAYPWRLRPHPPAPYRPPQPRRPAFGGGGGGWAGLALGALLAPAPAAFPSLCGFPPWQVAVRVVHWDQAGEVTEPAIDLPPGDSEKIVRLDLVLQAVLVLVVNEQAVLGTNGQHPLEDGGCATGP